jgi:hypothetical protein
MKVNRRLTLDYGLRWDYDTYLASSMADTRVSPTTPNPLFGNVMGAPIFEGSERASATVRLRITTSCFRTQAGFAYQISPKTVLRGGLPSSMTIPPALTALPLMQPYPYLSRPVPQATAMPS